jgi:hypothetical protein
MKFFVIAAIAISSFAPAAFAGQSGRALDTLLAAAGPVVPAQADAPAVPALVTVPALTSGLSDLSPAQADALVDSARASGFAVFELDGSQMLTKPALMAYTAKTLGLPADMDNWDAMIDYVGDMATFHRNNQILIMVRNASAIQKAVPQLYAQLRNVAGLSCQNANEWSRSAATLKFVFIP